MHWTLMKQRKCDYHELETESKDVQHNSIHEKRPKNSEPGKIHHQILTQFQWQLFRASLLPSEYDLVP